MPEKTHPTGVMRKYTAVFSSKTGPGLAHVLSVASYQEAWAVISKKYIRQGDLLALIPGHHPVMLQGALMSVASKYTTVVMPASPAKAMTG